MKNINQPAKKTKKKELSNDFLYHDMEEKVKLKTGTKVRINRKSENKGKIEIEYYSQDDLEKIWDTSNKRTYVHKEEKNVSV